jgi:tRNA G18 (ribose-2'-O)-methylase SpoU
VTRGYFGIGIYRSKTPVNVGTLWRSAYQLGAAFIFTVGKRYSQQASDTVKAWRHIPLLDFVSIDELVDGLPYSCPLVGVEMGGKPLSGFTHPERAVYLLGAEDHGLPDAVLNRCQHIVSLEAARTESFNVAVAGSLVMYDRMQRRRVA